MVDNVRDPSFAGPRVDEEERLIHCSLYCYRCSRMTDANTVVKVDMDNISYIGLGLPKSQDSRLLTGA